jgi:cysteine desulfurase
MSGRSYLDHNATSPLRPEAGEAMRGAIDCFGNPSSIHAEGRAARALIEGVRETIADMFQVQSAAVTFTSGGTEAANWLFQPEGSGRLAVSPTEHPSVLRGHRFASSDVSVLRVLEDGVVDLEVLNRTLSAGAVLGVQAANNETGVIQPMGEIAQVAHAKGATVVCDAVQAVGRLEPSSFDEADAIFFSAHKFGGPKGVGAVISKSGDAPALIRGGGQERRRRSGTENVAGIAGLGAALLAAVQDRSGFAKRARSLQLKLETGLRSAAPSVVIFGEGAARLPNTTCFAVPGKRAETLLIAFDLEGVSVSSGSACSSGKVERSHVLEAMGVPENLSEGAIRVSTGWNTQESDIERFLAAFSKICSSRRERRAA